jgi:hypothetical protein
MPGARPGIPIFYQLAPWLTDDLFIIQPITLPVAQSRAMHIARHGSMKPEGSRCCKTMAGG